MKTLAALITAVLLAACAQPAIADTRNTFDVGIGELRINYQDGVSPAALDESRGTASYWTSGKSSLWGISLVAHDRSFSIYCPQVYVALSEGSSKSAVSLTGVRGCTPSIAGPGLLDIHLPYALQFVMSMDSPVLPEGLALPTDLDLDWDEAVLTLRLGDDFLVLPVVPSP